MISRALSVLMAFLLFFSVGLQYNDPDPALWMVVYGMAGLLTAISAALPGRYPWPLPAIVGLWAMIWAATIAPGVVGQVDFRDMFRSFEMDNLLVEEARECVGLTTTGLWMSVLVAARLIERRAASGASGMDVQFE